ncbi:Uncharacterised protein [Mycobacteroides abscessus subsp. abscessus]|jgi:hypothetical protein|uniref:hypothetical protein n=1 Tax=Mycobacteroides abscessus TaxID=36809 RepID=UPI00092681E0|nr:hypothetical protein [Mycobacteroides abscessus]SII86074.1 Uncharacterised protein [Mycobacteroides abscessus subsp. abscessus]SIK03927.1 Uncharacterised protein [Mycobacteroides abscessus subsp. abscessus]SIK07306.1 Uncharacterised protein [Mycobacteroides abscessus subsp. abscessus]SIM06685.1 Uncharacterised protein [Mycobacteroides abscessus subsp. abscessus]SIN56954.1 Uncharacterised protein [Mycobacteroides abscessus subsp. abscessus]
MPDMTHRITVNGCDDETTFDMALTFDEAALLGEVSRLSRESSEYACQSTLSIKEIA